MEGLMYTQFECLSCGVWLKKSERQTHEKKFDHDIASKGVVVRAKEPELNIDLEPKLPKSIAVKVIETVKPYEPSEKSIEAYAREQYPSMYLLMDTIRGSMLNPQR